MFTYVIVVNDNGELKTISDLEMDRCIEDRFVNKMTGLVVDDVIEQAINYILDKRAAEEERVAAAGAQEDATD